jgi:hypothetical protein
MHTALEAIGLGACAAAAYYILRYGIAWLLYVGGLSK